MAQVDESDTTIATNDAYTGMLAISLIALIAGAALLYLDYSQYPSSKPPPVKAPVPKMEAPAPVPQQPPGGAAPGQAQPMNPMPMPPMQPMPENKGN